MGGSAGSIGRDITTTNNLKEIGTVPIFWGRVAEFVRTCIQPLPVYSSLTWHQREAAFRERASERGAE